MRFFAGGLKHEVRSASAEQFRSPVDQVPLLGLTAPPKMMQKKRDDADYHYLDIIEINPTKYYRIIAFHTFHGHYPDEHD